MIFNMRAGISVVQLGMVYSVIPQGNELSQLVLERMKVRVAALDVANMRYNRVAL